MHGAKPRYRAAIRKMYYEGRFCWAFFIHDTSLPAASFRIVEANASPDWSWDDAMITGLCARAMHERRSRLCKTT